MTLAANYPVASVWTRMSARGASHHCQTDVVYEIWLPNQGRCLEKDPRLPSVCSQQLSNWIMGHGEVLCGKNWEQKWAIAQQNWRTEWLGWANNYNPPTFEWTRNKNTIISKNSRYIYMEFHCREQYGWQGQVIFVLINGVFHTSTLPSSSTTTPTTSLSSLSPLAPANK